MYNIDLMRLRYCGLLPKARSSYSRHAHDAYEFHYIVGGRGSFEIRGPLARHRARETSSIPDRGTEHRAVVPTDGDYLLQYVAFLELDPELDAETRRRPRDATSGEGALRRLGDRHHEFFAQISRLSEAADAHASAARRPSSSRRFSTS